MSGFRGGDIVECVDDVPVRSESTAMPVRGQLYTVASIRAVEGGASVRLREILPTCYLGRACACGGCGWDARRFRRVLRPDAGWLARLLEDVNEPA